MLSWTWYRTKSFCPFQNHIFQLHRDFTVKPCDLLCEVDWCLDDLYHGGSLPWGKHHLTSLDPLKPKNIKKKLKLKYALIRLMIFTMAVPFLEESITKPHSIHHAEPFTVVLWELSLQNPGTSFAGHPHTSDKIKYKKLIKLIVYRWFFLPYATSANWRKMRPIVWQNSVRFFIMIIKWQNSLICNATG